jgi:pSer/pThr/pTyr-binding forkhead associated (FHA) protein
LALTVTVLSGKNKASEAFRLTFDAPRIVVGRSDGCEVRLPDPTVSLRHASIRSRGAEYLLVDENSKNGTLLGKVLLSPLSPRVLRNGDRIRVGRLWLELTIGPPVAAVATPAAARGLALALVSEALAERGEPAGPMIRVVEGPDAGKTLPLVELGRLHVLGRANEAHLALDDDAASRRHVGVTAKGDRVVVQDLGSKGGAALDGAPLGPNETPWRPGQALEIGRNVLALIHPAAEALAQIERGPDEAMTADERSALDEPESESPPPVQGEPTPTPAPASTDDFPETPPPPSAGPRVLARPKRASKDGWGVTDAAVVLLALGVLILSAAGWWLLGK